MNFIPAPLPANESRRQEAVERLQIKGTNQHDVMVVYSEMAQELTGFAAVADLFIEELKKSFVFKENKYVGIYVYNYEKEATINEIKLSGSAKVANP